MRVSDAELDRIYAETEPITFEAQSAPEVVETVEIEGRQVSIVRYATLTMPTQDSTPVFGRTTRFAAIPAGAEVHPLSRTFYVNTSQHRRAGDATGGRCVASVKDRSHELAECATVKATIKAARERIERDRLHAQYAPVAERNIGTHTRDAFEALDADAEIEPGDLVVVYSHQRYRTGVALKVTKTRVECLAATPTGGTANGATRKKGDDVRLLRKATPAAPVADTVEWPAGKTFGELDPDTRRAVTRQAADRLSVELSHPALAEAVLAPLPAESTESDLEAVGVAAAAATEDRAAVAGRVLAATQGMDDAGQGCTLYRVVTARVGARQVRIHDGGGVLLGTVEEVKGEGWRAIAPPGADRPVAEPGTRFGTFADAVAAVRTAAAGPGEPQTPRGRWAAGLAPALPATVRESLADAAADFHAQTTDLVADVDGRPFGAGALVEYVGEPDAALDGWRGRVSAVDARNGRWVQLRLGRLGSMIRSADRVRVVADEDRAEVDAAMRRYVAGATVPSEAGEMTRAELLALTTGDRVEVLLGAATGGPRIDPRGGWVPATVEGVSESLNGHVDLWVVVDYPAGVYGRNGARTHTEHFTAGGRCVRRPAGEHVQTDNETDDQAATGAGQEGETMGQTEAPVLLPDGLREEFAADPVGVLLGLVDEHSRQREQVITSDEAIGRAGAVRAQLAEMLSDPATLRAVADRVERDQAERRAAGPVIVHEGRGDAYGVAGRMLSGSLSFESYDGGEWRLAGYDNNHDLDEGDLVGAQAWAAKLMAAGHDYDGGEVTVLAWEHHRDGYGDWWEPIGR